MSVKNTKLILSVCLLLGVLGFILGCTTSSNPNSNPVSSFRITMDVNQHEELFTQLQSFADKHSLEFKLSLYDSDNILFLAALYGDGFHITAVNVSSSPKEIRVSFYNETSTPTPEKTIDELFDDLKNFIGEIPNVTITEQP